MTSQRWYKYLKSSDRLCSDKDNDGHSDLSHIIKDEKKEGRALLDYVEPEAKTLIVCQEVEYRFFTKFNSYLDFAAFCRGKIANTHKCFYECIFTQIPQKPYFDLDIPSEPEKDVMKLEEAKKMPGVPSLPPSSSSVHSNEKKAEKSNVYWLSKEDADRALQHLIQLISQVCPHIQPEDIMVFSSHGPHKRSFHIVIDRWCYPDAADNRAFHDKIMGEFPQEWRGAVDHKMYKSIQQFRILGSHKFGSDRWKVVSPFSTWQPDTKAEDDNHTSLQILGASLISNSSYCKLLPSYLVHVEKPVYDGIGIELTSEDIETVTRLCAEYKELPVPSLPSVKPQSSTVPTPQKDAVNIPSLPIQQKDVEPEPESKRTYFPFKVSGVKDGMVFFKRQMPSHCIQCKRVHEKEHAFASVSGENRIVSFYCRRADHGKRIVVGSLGPSREVDFINFLKEIKPLASFNDGDDTDRVEISSQINETPSACGGDGVRRTIDINMRGIPIGPQVTGIELAVKMQELQAPAKVAQRIDHAHRAVESHRNFGFRFDIPSNPTGKQKSKTIMNFQLPSTQRPTLTFDISRAYTAKRK